MFHEKAIVILIQERDGMHWHKNWPASRQEMASLKFGLLD